MKKRPTEKLGLILIMLGLFLPLLIVFIPLLGFDMKTSAMMAGLTIILPADIMLIIGIALAGKEGYNLLKTKIERLFRRALFKPQVSRKRYYFGLSLVFGGTFSQWVYSYYLVIVGIPVGERAPLIAFILMEFLIIAGYIAMGEEFWNKIKALFQWNATARTTNDLNTKR